MTCRRTRRVARDNPHTALWLLGMLAYLSVVITLALLGLVHL